MSRAFEFRVTATFGNDGDAWLALYSDPGLQFELQEEKPSDTFSVDDFNRNWRGFEKINDRCYVITGDLPMLTLRERPTEAASVSQQHDLKVQRDRLELTYSATLRPERSPASCFLSACPMIWNC